MNNNLIAWAAVLATATTAMAQELKYPEAPRDNTVDTYFGVQVKDPYRPLEDDNSAATTAWVEAQNQLTQGYLQRIPFRGKMLKRLKQVANYGKVSAPSFNKKTGKWYFSKNDGLQNQSVIYEMDELGDEQNARVFLDPNRLSSDGTVALQGICISNDGKYCAYAISRSGSDWQEFYVMDAKTRQLLDDHIVWAKFSGAAWYKDGFFYSAYDRPDENHAFSSKNSTHKIYYHKMGTPQSQDRLFYHNPSKPMEFFSTSVNDEETLQFLYESGAGAGANVYVRSLKEPDAQFVQLTSNMDNQYNPIEVVDDKIYWLTNDGAPKFKLMVTDMSHPGMEEWKTVIPESDNMMESAQLIGGKLYVTYMVDACDQVKVYSLDGQYLQDVSLPGPGSVGVYGQKDRSEVFYSFTSFTQPNVIYRYDAATGTATPYAKPAVKVDLSKFETKQVFCQSKDGTRVPMFITYKKGLKLNGKNPTYLYSYGGFNIPMTPFFSTNLLVFMEKGGIYAQPSIRGGSEYGEQWHLAGTKMQKQNVFDDFIAAAEYLIREGYTSSDYLAIVGGSNGGLLVGACETQRPDLFKVCVPQVGVMDMLRYHKFTIGWNWASDYGTSEDSKEMFEYLRAYSPLHNIKKGVSYPATLITTADHDDRVVPAHSFKFAATMQQAQAGSAPVLIRIDTKAGHGGGKPLSKRLEETADIYSFILYNMGLKD